MSEYVLRLSVKGEQALRHIASFKSGWCLVLAHDYSFLVITALARDKLITGTALDGAVMARITNRGRAILTALDGA